MRFYQPNAFTSLLGRSKLLLHHNIVYQRPKHCSVLLNLCLFDQLSKVCSPAITLSGVHGSYPGISQARIFPPLHKNAAVRSHAEPSVKGAPLCSGFNSGLLFEAVLLLLHFFFFYLSELFFFFYLSELFKPAFSCYGTNISIRWNVLCFYLTRYSFTWHGTRVFYFFFPPSAHRRNTARYFEIHLLLFFFLETIST